LNSFKQFTTIIDNNTNSNTVKQMFYRQVLYVLFVAT